jgi:hypothetical protein
MADKTPISQLPAGALTGANVDVDADYLAIDDVSAGNTKKITPKELVANAAVFVQSGIAATNLETYLQSRRETIYIAAGSETGVIAAGTGKVTFRMPYAFLLTGVRASLTGAASTGTFTVDINEGGTTILSTKLTIDATEKTSTTAAIAAVISDTTLADDAEISIDVDDDGAGDATGLKVYLIGYKTSL